ncbi:hypothetical protein ACTA71_011695 [Dictyostelium dimigraforme]
MKNMVMEEKEYEMVRDKDFKSLTISENLCTPEILTVSETNPYNPNSPIEITGTFCTKNITMVSFNVGGSKQLQCENIIINDSEDSITCSLSNALEPTTIPPINFNQFYNLSIQYIGITNNAISNINFPYYLYVNSSCPKGCKNHGICDIGNTCRCKNDYASFNCAYKVKNESLLPLPTGTDFNQFKFTTTNDVFNIKFSHMLATQSYSSPSSSSSSSITNFEQIDISNQYLIEESSTISGLGFISSNKSSWLNYLYYNVDYFDRQSTSSSFSFRNFRGSYLPESSTSSLISIQPVINPILINNNNTFEIVFELSNLKNNMDSIKWEISESGNSILVNDQKSHSLLLFSLADIYDFDDEIYPSHSFLKILNTNDQSNINPSNLINYSKNSMYLSISITQSTFNQTSLGSYFIRLMINAYDTPGVQLQGWEIALIVFASVALFSFIVFVIILIVKARLAKRRSRSLKLKNLDINGEDKPLVDESVETTTLL